MHGYSIVVQAEMMSKACTAEQGSHAFGWGCEHGRIHANSATDCIPLVLRIGIHMQNLLFGLIVRESRKWLPLTAHISSRILVHCLGSAVAGTVQP
jgi:hypothetical protein